LTWLVPITLLVAVCALVGGLIARQVYAVAKPAAVSHEPATSAPASTSDGRPPGDDKTVYFTPFAQGDPQYEKVRNAIQSYFNATNHRDYNLWRSVMTAKVVESQPQQSWIGGLKSTQDSDMTVYRIEATDSGADVFGSFKSTQDPKDAPQDLQVACIDWHMVWPMVNTNGVLRIDSPSVTKQKCP
jgi:hypothetical protein